ncbi:MAG: STAS domain-containing protein [Streptosporangiaceae bacterium]|nr:STAS domain-containing protein [Streptosporangiaceae bacterium]MBV9856512.1 STAS domain-containing protein [Streptosporangiaceae bacterium]
MTVQGEMDIATADQAYAYIRDVIDELRVPVSVDLAGLTFCDARGLGVLARLACYAGREGGRLRLTSPRPPLVKIMRITGLDEVFPELASLATQSPSPRVRGRRAAVHQG